MDRELEQETFGSLLMYRRRAEIDGPMVLEPFQAQALRRFLHWPPPIDNHRRAGHAVRPVLALPQSATAAPYEFLQSLQEVPWEPRPAIRFRTFLFV
jgi:hypothetical protein